MAALVKYIQANHQIDNSQVERLKLAIQAEFKKKQEPTHIGQDLFVRLAEPILKVPNLVETNLYKQLFEALTEIIGQGND